MEFTQLPKILNVRVIVFETIWALDFHVNHAHELLHVLDGRFELTFPDGRRYPAQSGDTLFVPGGTMHKDIFEFEDDLKILYLNFQWEHFEEFSRTVTNANINKLSPDSRNEIRWIFEKLREDRGGGELDRLVAGARVMNILSLIHRELNSPNEAETENDARHELIQAARRYIERNFALPLRLEDIAVHLRVSPFHLSRMFSQESDFSLFEYLSEVRINEAKKLLRDGRLLVSEVAERTGYDNGNYFAKVFRRKVGCSPGKYRSF
jgi:AraC-like DNA-binding protein/mannose-6-phosphate isomerase-like protein (cupin superfamily)